MHGYCSKQQPNKLCFEKACMLSKSLATTGPSVITNIYIHMIKCEYFAHLPLNMMTASEESIILHSP